MDETCTYFKCILSKANNLKPSKENKLKVTHHKNYKCKQKYNINIYAMKYLAFEL